MFSSRGPAPAALFGALAALASLVWPAGDADAAAGAWWRNDHGAVRLIAAGAAAGDAESLSFGLHFRMKPGWKIYWRSPGDAGFPPQPNWAGSKNLATAVLSWPAPERFSVLGLNTLGYEDEVVLPVAVTPFEPGKAVRLRAVVRYLTCEEICVPYEAPLALDLPAGPEADAPEAALIERFAKKVPAPGPTAALAITGALVDGPPGNQVLRVAVRSDSPLEAPDLLVEAPARFGIGTARTELRDGGLGAVLRVPVGVTGKALADGRGDLAGEPVTLTLVHAGRAVEQRFMPPAGLAVLPPRPAPARPATGGAASIAWILVLAVAGGLILNLMPCVLPVLSIKLLTVVGHGGGDPGRVRAGFLASAAGILVSFLALASGAVALKTAGLAIGWGIQFQQPAFLVAMALLLTLFACNLWGLFEITLPSWLADEAAAAGHGHGLAGHFAAGAFATLLATPCTAPFLGTAVGFALARGAGEIYTVFTALGIGLALPYLAVAAAPGLATRLPRPGPWMIVLRRILGLALAGTALWLVSVLAAQAGPAFAAVAAAVLAALASVLGVLRARPRLRRYGAWALVGVLAVMASVAINAPRDARAPNAPSEIAGEIAWRPFDPAAIEAEVAAGRIVFVDVTADWCLTCKVNKAVVLDSETVGARLGAPGVIAMQADWTRPDPVITAFLQRFSRYGIPFDVVFGPGAPEGHVLPELLTESSVLAGFDAAAGGRRLTTR